MSKTSTPAVLSNKYFKESSVFRPENLLREARRQKQMQDCSVPEICILDPDGDLVRYFTKIGKAEKNRCWACYHSELYNFELDGKLIGIIPCVVGASYAVLVAEQLFVSGCTLLISVTSAGIVTEKAFTKRFGLITEAIRDEGTSYHYLPSEIPSRLCHAFREQLCATPETDNNPYFEVKSWTTDAPYRETESALLAMGKKNVVCVEMEAAALYAFAQKMNKSVICFAHLTNNMAQKEGDFEKGEEFGSLETIGLISTVLNLLEQTKKKTSG